MKKLILFELRKVFSKRLSLIVLVGILLFSVLISFSTYQNKYAFDGVSAEGSGKTAVEIDKEIAAKYEGILTDEKVQQKLTALSIVGRLENGLDTRIGASLYDDGIDLSGGETQKIVATRTLLDNADIWIFDEPVAAMDPSSEYSFFNTVLEEDDKSKTMIFVSHRLKIASKMNRIIYLENGKIVGIGTHQQLMTGCEKYRRYYVSWLLMEND